MRPAVSHRASWKHAMRRRPFGRECEWALKLDIDRNRKQRGETGAAGRGSDFNLARPFRSEVSDALHPIDPDRFRPFPTGSMRRGRRGCRAIPIRWLRSRREDARRPVIAGFGQRGFALRKRRYRCVAGASGLLAKRDALKFLLIGLTAPASFRPDGTKTVY